MLLRESARTISDEQYRASLDGDLREALVIFGSQYLAFANEIRLSAWDRLIASANDIYPELALRLYDAGPGRAYRLLTDILHEADRKGLLRIPEPAVAAEELTGVWYGYTVLRVNLKVMPPLIPQGIRRRAERGVEVLYRLYAPGNEDCAAAAADCALPGSDVRACLGATALPTPCRFAPRNIGDYGTVSHRTFLHGTDACVCGNSPFPGSDMSVSARDKRNSHALEQPR